MKQKLLSILALLLMTATGAWADTTVTWTASDMSGIYIDFTDGEAYNNTIKGITVTSSGGGRAGDSWERTDINLNSGSTTITFTSSVGKIKSIAITAEDMEMSSTPSGWTTDYSTLSWSGEASTTVSLPLSGGTYISEISEIVFTIESSTVNVTGITLDKTEASMIVGGETLPLTPTVAPNDATDKTVTWTTSDADVATVADGVVTAVAAGTATITATATNGTAATSDDKAATCAVTVSKTVTANPGAVAGEYWSTFYNASATQGYTADASTTVYKAALNGTSSVTLTEVTGREIPAGQAVILKSTTGSITLTPAATTSSDFTGNDLKGGTTVTSGYDAYTLSRGDGSGPVGFYKFSGSLDGSKAHLEIPTSAGTRSFIGFGDDNTTGIELPALADDEAAEWYSLDGRRLSGKPAHKGIYVKDGQKYIIK